MAFIKPTIAKVPEEDLYWQRRDSSGQNGFPQETLYASRGRGATWSVEVAWGVLAGCGGNQGCEELGVYVVSKEGDRRGNH